MHCDPVCAIHLRYPRIPQLERLISAMQGQFLALTYLMLHYLPIRPRRPSARALPVRFLGGHAPRLQTLELHCIPFPALPKLLLSTTDLVRLHPSVGAAFRVHFTRDDDRVPVRVDQLESLTASLTGHTRRFWGRHSSCLLLVSLCAAGDSLEVQKNEML